MLGTIEVRNSPPLKAPKWPRQSMSCATSLNSSRKAARRTTMKMILNLKMKPICRKAGQFMMIYPMLSPIIPQRLVVDPAFSIGSVYSRLLRMLPAMPESINTMSTLAFPKVYSRRLTSSSKMRTLLTRCSMFTCKNCAVTSRYTSPLYTRRESLMPISVRVSQLTSSTVFEESKPRLSSTTKRTVMARMRRKVREVRWTEGQKVLLSMMQQLSSSGSTTATLPARNNILLSSMYEIFSSVMPTRNIPLSISLRSRLTARLLLSAFWASLGTWAAGIWSLLSLIMLSCMRGYCLLRCNQLQHWLVGSSR